MISALRRKFWHAVDTFLTGLVDRHFDNEGARRTKRITRD
jgi:hypothetical protein